MSEGPPKAVVFDISRYMIEDGPGIRTNVFLKGCPLRCKWCSNPFGLSRAPEIAYNRRKCILCGTCVEVCREQACTLQDDRIQTDRDRCTACGRCADACLTHARVLVGAEYTAAEVIQRVREDAAFYRRDGGGVTLSGGEVLMQAEAAREILRLARASMIHTAIETSAYAPWKRLEQLLPLCDLVFVDLKHIDPRAHVQLTGVPNDRILENIRRLAAYVAKHGSPQLVLRLPVIRALNDDRPTMHATARFIGELPGTVTVNILPYHELGITKYEMIDLPYPLDPDAEGDLEGLKAYCDIIRQYAPTAPCSVGGGEIDYCRVRASGGAPAHSH
jgi:glycyl-radical enzyme activating protein